jgi:hypothetical protein
VRARQEAAGSLALSSTGLVPTLNYRLVPEFRKMSTGVRAGEKQRHFSRCWPAPAAPGASAGDPIGGDAVGTLQQTLYRLRRADGSGFLKVEAQTYLGGSDFPATLLPVLPASFPPFQTPSRPGRLQSAGVSGQAA